MKKLLNIFLCLILIFVLSCDKNDFNPDYSQGKATAIRNGEIWIGQGRGTINNFSIGVEFGFEVFNETGILRQGLDFNKIPSKKGKYYLTIINGQSQDSIPGCSFATISHDGDVVEDRYLVNESEVESYLTVTKYDETNRRLVGEFRIKLYIDPNRPKSNPSNPDTILFENGYFEVIIEE